MGTWHRLRTNTVDCLIVAYYPSGHPRFGDYFWVDVPKYTKSAANVYLALVTSKDRATQDTDGNHIRFWEMRPSRIAFGEQDRLEVPLVFRLLSEKPIRIASYEERRLSGIRELLLLLDSYIKSSVNEKKALYLDKLFSRFS